MQARHLFLQGFLTCLMLASANYAVGRMASTTVASQLLEKCRNNIHFTDLFLGNSLIAAGIDEKAFDKASGSKHKAFNAGCGSTSPLEHALLLQEINSPAKGRIFYGFYDTQLTDQSSIHWNSLTGNRTILFKTDPQKFSFLFDNQDYLQFIFLKILAKAPIAYERLAIWAKVEKARRAIGAIGFGSPESNRFGRTEDFQLLEPTNSESFDQRLSDLVSHQTSLSKPIRAIISYAKQNDLEIIIALMPMTSDHRLKFNSSLSWNAYFSHIRNLLEKDGIKLVNALDWMDDYLFEDNLHLSKAGARKFSKRLGESLK